MRKKVWKVETVYENDVGTATFSHKGEAYLWANFRREFAGVFECKIYEVCGGKENLLGTQKSRESAQK